MSIYRTVLLFFLFCGGEGRLGVDGISISIAADYYNSLDEKVSSFSDRQTERRTERQIDIQIED